MNNQLWKGLVIASFGLSASSLYFTINPISSALHPVVQAQLDELEAHRQWSKKLPIPLTDVEVVMLVDERMEVLAKRKDKVVRDNSLDSFALAPESGTDKRLYGNIGARLTLREFSDLECPWCKKMHPELKQIVDASKGVINWEFIHFPLDIHNPVAAYQAMAVECVANDYDNQTAWGFIHKLFEQTRGGGTGADLPGTARSLGLDSDRMERCIADGEHREVIQANLSSGKQLGVTGTPAIQLVDNQTGRTALIKSYVEQPKLLQMIRQFLGAR